MMKSTLSFKEKLNSGQPVVVVNTDHPSASLVETLGKIGADAVFFDCEQGSPDIESVENMARAARLTGVTSLVRLFSGQDWVIERLMLRGVDGIVVPRIDTPEQAARVVDAVRYCFPKTHTEKIVVIQIETISAVSQLSRFLAVDGIDVFFIGPVDLARSMGHGNEYTHPEVQETIDRTLLALRRAGKIPGCLVHWDTLEKYLRAGVLFLYTHVDTLLVRGLEDFTQMIHPHKTA